MARVLFLALLVLGCAKSPSSGAPDATTTSTTEPECPKNIGADLVGKSCSKNGQICSPSTGAVRMLQCSSGKWVELNVPPGPK